MIGYSIFRVNTAFIYEAQNYHIYLFFLDTQDVLKGWKKVAEPVPLVAPMALEEGILEFERVELDIEKILSIV